MNEPKSTQDQPLICTEFIFVSEQVAPEVEVENGWQK